MIQLAAADHGIGIHQCIAGGAGQLAEPTTQSRGKVYCQIAKAAAVRHGQRLCIG
jgi:hypothetical protein